MDSIINKSLAQIVNSNYKAANVFEKFHLDFCCKGKRTLLQACQESNLQVDDVIAELEKNNLTDSLTTKVNFHEMTLAQLTDYIISTHHQYVKNEMPVLLNYLEKIADKHGERHPEMKKVFQLFAAIKEELEHHMQKEELVLFPRIIDIENRLNEGNEIIINSSYLLSPMSMMEKEHDHAGSMLAEIRDLTNNFNPPDDACTTYKLSFASLHAFELDLHQHVHLENNILFPNALKLFLPQVENSMN